MDREAKTRGFEPRLDWQPPLSELRDGGCYRANYEFVVDTLGFPEIATIRDVSVNNSSFGQAVRDVIPRLRYEPAQLRGAPVRQTVAYQQSVAVRKVISSSQFPPPPPSRPPKC